MRTTLFALVLTGALTPAVHAQTYTWIGTTSSWNTTSNWNPIGVPNVAGESALFTDTGVNLAPFLASSIVLDQLRFSSTAILGGNSYTIGGAAGVTMTVPSIVYELGIVAVQSINLPAATGGSLRFTGSGGVSDLRIENFAVAFANPSLIIGPTTTIGSTTGAGGITISGSGHTRISGDIVTSINRITKNGPGELSLTGTNSFAGDTSVLGGRLTLDYTGNINSKLPGGTLQIRSSELRVVGNTSFTEIVESTLITGGHSSLRMTGSAGGAFNLNAITSTSPSTADFSRATGGSFLTTNPNISGILGSWATSDGGAGWAAVAAGAIVPYAAYGVNGNIDVTSAASLSSGFTHNTLRFNSFGGSINLSGTNTVTAGGLLMTPNATGNVILNGTGSLNSGFELIVHQHSAGGLYINLDIVAPNLVKTGPGVLGLGGTNSGLTGNITVNQGQLAIYSTASVNSASSFVFNPNAVSETTVLTAALPVGTSGTILPDISLAGLNGSIVRLELHNLGDAQVTYSGVISSSGGSNDHSITVTHADPVNGRTILSGTNTFQGDVRLESGTLAIASNAALGNSANRLTIDSGSTSGGFEFLTNGTDLARPVTNLGGRVIVNGSNVNTISSLISGSGSLYKRGTGTLVLSNSGNTNGSLQIEAGTLRAMNDGSLGNPFFNMTIHAGATLSNGSTFVMGSGRTITLGAPGEPGPATIDVLAGTSLTVSGLVQGSGTLRKTGTGTLILNGMGIYGGGTLVERGLLIASTNGALGSATGPVTVETLGALTFTGSTTTGRTFQLNSSTLSAGPGATVTFNNATVSGGFLTGAFATQAGGSNTFVGSQTTTSASMTLNGADSLTNFANGGQLTIPAARTSTLTRFTNTSSGRMTVSGTANVTDFVSDGQIAILPGGTLNAGSGGVVVGGGSVTNIGIYNPANQQVTPGGTLNFGSGDMRVQGGFVRNNGLIIGTGNLIIEYGGLIKNAGEIDTPFAPIRINGGELRSGNSPGLGRVSNFSLVSTAVTGGDFSNATGIAGPPIGSTGTQLSGWSVFEYGNSTNTGGSARIEGTPASRAIWQFRTVVDGGDYSTAGTPANFDAAQNYIWQIIRPRSAADAANPANTTPTNTVAVLSIFDTATMTTVPLSDATLNQYLRFDDTAWNWGTVPVNLRGMFSFVLMPDALGAANRVIAVSYTPVPEPVGILAVALGAWLLRRRIRYPHKPEAQAKGSPSQA